VPDFRAFGAEIAITPCTENSNRAEEMNGKLILMEAKNDAHETVLRYVEIPVAGTQKRLRDRIALVPDLDFAAFTCRAVIDWLEVGIEVLEDTQARWVNDTICQSTGLSCRVDGANREFRVRFQDPELQVVQKAILAIETRHGISKDACVAALEVSIDFTPRDPNNEDLRRQLVGMLIRHLQPGRDVLADKGDWPRFTWGSGTKNTTGMFDKRQRAATCFMFNTNDRKPFSDATVYFGRQGGSAAWRVMDKILDRQNPTAGTRDELPPEKRRTRIEITLQQDELEKLGIRSLEDLATFPFTRLAKPYFRFFLPTCADPSKVRHQHVRRALQAERWTKFDNTGIVGLTAMDEAWEARRREQRKELVRGGGQPLPRRRVGVGSAGTHVAFDRLNERIEAALKKLTKRIGSVAW
jgi:hypothetical protein